MTPVTSPPPHAAEVKTRKKRKVSVPAEGSLLISDEQSPPPSRPSAPRKKEIIAGVLAGIALFFFFDGYLQSLGAAGGLGVPGVSTPSWLTLGRGNGGEKTPPPLTKEQIEARDAFRQSSRAQRILSRFLKQGLEELPKTPETKPEELRATPQGSYLVSLAEALEAKLEQGKKAHKRWSRHLTSGDSSWWKKDLNMSNTTLKAARKTLNLGAIKPSAVIAPPVALLVRLEEAKRGLLAAVKRFVDNYPGKNDEDGEFLWSAHTTAREALETFEGEDAQGAFSGLDHINGVLRMHYEELKKFYGVIPPLLMCFENKKKTPLPRTSKQVFDAAEMHAEGLKALLDVRRLYPERVEDKTIRRWHYQMKALLSKTDARIAEGSEKLGFQVFENGKKIRAFAEETLRSFEAETKINEKTTKAS
ncbi:hypothetical protein Emed_004404 [Eimeria media]